MQVFRDIDQTSPEWFALRMGIPTASNFSRVMAKPGPRSTDRAKYMRTLAAEIITGEHCEEWAGNRHTERGKEREDEARALYAFMHNVEPERIGFVKNGNCGASPDGFVGTVGGIEIKDCLAHIQIERLQDGTLPSQYRWQVIGSLLVCEDREWWDFVSHCRGLPLFECRVYREKVKTELAELREGIDRFYEETTALVKWIEAMR